MLEEEKVLLGQITLLVLFRLYTFLPCFNHPFFQVLCILPDTEVKLLLQIQKAHNSPATMSTACRLYSETEKQSKTRYFVSDRCD